MRPVTRFAPSPTGNLHIGSARTALFNWLFARANGGTFLLRIEDTDRARSTEAAIQAIHDGMDWLGLDHDGEVTYQFSRADRHAEVARELLAAGNAYKCFASQDDIRAFRDSARAKGTSTLFQSPWRDADPSTHPDAPYVIRLRAPRNGRIEIPDAVQGNVTWDAATLDDMVLLRQDGTPTYMHAVVVDDHDMGVSHVIRGDDHLTNAARQSLIFDAMGWDRPVFAHVPLIHGPDGKKLSKRHGATGVGEYRDAGYPAYAMLNYLARLGWSHGDDEYFTTEQAIEWFSLDGIGQSPARFDFKKLGNLSGQHIRARDDDKLMEEFLHFAATQQDFFVPDNKKNILRAALPLLKDRAKTYQDIVNSSYFALADRPLAYDEKSEAAINSVSRGILKRLTSRLQHDTWGHDFLEAEVKKFAEDENLKLGEIAQPLRAALTGRANSPSVFAIMDLLGADESLARIRDAIG